LRRISVGSGAVTNLTEIDPSKEERSHVWPAALPGGRDLLFSIITTQNNANEGKIAVLSLETGRHHIVVERGYNAQYAESGHLVYMLDGNLMAVPFDLSRLAVTGAPVAVADGVETRTGNTGSASFGISPTGFLVYAEGSESGRTLVWVDRLGREEPIAAPPRNYLYPRIAPDGSRVAIDVRDQATDIWIWDFARRALTNLTVNQARDVYPAWSPDGQRIVFGSARAGPDNLYMMRADGSGVVARLTEGLTAQIPYGFSPDGGVVLFRQNVRGTGRDVHALSLANRQTRPLINTAAIEENAEISPDGRWVAYEATTESARNEIYVRPFPGVDAGRWLVSSHAACCPLWSRDGHEIFYISNQLDGVISMHAVPVAASESFTAGVPQKVFEGRYVQDSNGRSYDVSPDGKRFLMIRPVAAASGTGGPSRFIAVLNWFDELKQRAPAQR
jgi:serine/threonine-protein kinase